MSLDTRGSCPDTLALRRASNLPRDLRLHPVKGVWPKLAGALDSRDRAIDRGYPPEQVGIFAEEVCLGGARRFLVDTYAGFALSVAPRPEDLHGSKCLPARHFYEVLLQDRPCWLYFDLEFSKTANPSADPEAVTTVFYSELSRFCREVLDVVVEMSSVVEVDASTQAKFSKHIIMKGIFAFANNAQVGMVVAEFVAYLVSQRAIPGSESGHLFFNSGKGPAVSNCGAEDRKHVLVDKSVYSRNRCFRLPFSTKFGEQRPFLFCRASTVGESPAMLLLRSYAGFLPAGTRIFRNAFVPPDLRHEAHGTRPLKLVATGQLEGHERLTERHGLLLFLLSAWDAVRREHDRAAGPAVESARVQSCCTVGSPGTDFLVVGLAGNRFCCCKGGSHLSNGIYLVVDPRQRTFVQKCHDDDCRPFRSREHQVPAGLIDAYSQRAMAVAPPHDCTALGGGKRRLQVTPTRAMARPRVVRAVFRQPECSDTELDTRVDSEEVLDAESEEVEDAVV